MAESADSLIRRGVISGKQAEKRGFMKKKAKPAKDAKAGDKGGKAPADADEINKNGKPWPAEKNASAKTPINPKVKAKIAPEGGQYGGGGQKTQ